MSEELATTIHQRLQQPTQRSPEREGVEAGVQENRARAVGKSMARLVRAGASPRELVPLLTTPPNIAATETLINKINSLPPKNPERERLEAMVLQYLRQFTPIIVGEDKPDVIARFNQLKEFEERVQRGQLPRLRQPNPDHVRAAGLRLATVMQNHPGFPTIVEAAESGKLPSEAQAQLITAMVDMMRAHGQEIPPTLLPETVIKLYGLWLRERNAVRQNAPTAAGAVSTTIAETVATGGRANQQDLLESSTGVSAQAEIVDPVLETIRENERRIRLTEKLFSTQHRAQLLQMLPSTVSLPLNYRRILLARSPTPTNPPPQNVIARTPDGTTATLTLLSDVGNEALIYETTLTTTDGERLPIVVKICRVKEDNLQLKNTFKNFLRNLPTLGPFVVPEYSYNASDGIGGDVTIVIQPKLEGRVLDAVDQVRAPHLYREVEKLGETLNGGYIAEATQRDAAIRRIIYDQGAAGGKLGTYQMVQGKPKLTINQLDLAVGNFILVIDDQGRCRQTYLIDT